MACMKNVFTYYDSDAVTGYCMGRMKKCRDH